MFVGKTKSGHKLYICKPSQLPIAEMKWPGIWLVKAGTKECSAAVKELV